MASSPRVVIRAIVQSSRAPRRGPSLSPSLPILSRNVRHQGTQRPLMMPHTCSSHRLFSTSFRPHQAQPAAVSRPASTPSAPTTAPTTTSSTAPGPTRSTLTDLKAELADKPRQSEEQSQRIDWTTSFHGLSDTAFSKDAADVLLKPIEPNDVEIKPDGIIYLPEIKYRRILNRAFGPGGWGLAPRGESTVTAKSVTREYALLVHGRLVSIARGEQSFFSPEGIATAAEGCKSNALMRCCKDLGVASELWDPRFIRKFKAEMVKEVWVEHVMSKKKTRIWTRKGDDVPYPWKESKGFGGLNGA